MNFFAGHLGRLQIVFQPLIPSGVSTRTNLNIAGKYPVVIDDELLMVYGSSQYKNQVRIINMRSGEEKHSADIDNVISLAYHSGQVFVLINSKSLICKKFNSALELDGKSFMLYMK